MNRTKKIILIAFIIGALLIIFSSLPDKNKVGEKQYNNNINDNSQSNEELKNNETDNTNQEVDYSKYSFEFAEGSIKDILKRNIGDKKAYFYLPPTGYIEVSRGSSYGIAFALQDKNPGSGENFFEFLITPDDSTLENCEVTYEEAQSWITRGRTSFGKLPANWVDMMVAYFTFPENIKPCTAIYNFNLTRDKEPFASEQLEFRIL